MKQSIFSFLAISILLLGACNQNQQNGVPPVFDESLNLSALEKEFDKINKQIEKAGIEDHILYEYFTDQQGIITRLMDGIKADEEKPDSLLSHEIPLQKEECAQLINSLKIELQLINKNLAFEKQETETINVKDFGAKGDGIVNDREAIAEAFEKAKEMGNGTKILFPEGTYSIYVPENARVSGNLELIGLKDVIIEGQGEAVLLFKTYRTGLRIEDCHNLKFKNLQIDYDPLPFTQGVITKVDYEKDLVEIQIQEGFPLPNNDKFKKASFLRGTMNHPETGHLYQKGDWRVKNLEEVENITFRFGLLSNYGFERKGLAKDLKEGHIFVMHARGTPSGGPAIFL